MYLVSITWIYRLFYQHFSLNIFCFPCDTICVVDGLFLYQTFLCSPCLFLVSITAISKSEASQQDHSTLIETLNPEKQEQNNPIPPNPDRIENQNAETGTTRHQHNKKKMVTLEDKINVELIKKIITETKSPLPSLRNRDWKNPM